jgi:hypothetical protein
MHVKASTKGCWIVVPKPIITDHLSYLVHHEALATTLDCNELHLSPALSLLPVEERLITAE